MTDYQLWPATNGPGSSNSDTGLSLGTEWSVGQDGLYAKALRFWRADTAITGPVVGRIYQVTGPSSGTAVSGTDVTFTLSGTGWQTAPLGAPVSLTSGQHYKAVCYFPGNYASTGGYWATGAGVGGITNGPLSAPDASSAAQGSFNSGASIAYPTDFFGGANYWVDVTVTDATGTIHQAAASGGSVSGGSAAVGLVLAVSAAAAAVSAGLAAATLIVPGDPVTHRPFTGATVRPNTGTTARP